MRGCFIRMGLISNIKSSERSFKGLHIRGTVQKGKKEAWPLGWRVPGPARANARRLPAHNKHCERSPTAVLFLHDKFTLSFLQELGNITILKREDGWKDHSWASTHFLLLRKPLPLYMLRIAGSFESCLSSSIFFLKWTYRYITHILKWTPIYCLFLLFGEDVLPVKGWFILAHKNTGDRQLLWVVFCTVKSTVHFNLQMTR